MAAIASPPSEFKSLAVYLQRAQELRSADPVIAYWCMYHAAQLGMALRTTEPDSRRFLFALLDQLEASKKTLDDNEAVTNDAASSAYVENFALKVFNGADAEDRAGHATRATAKKFHAAVTFLELLSNFGTVDEENLAKIKYAKWKAADIAKAFREGRVPTPGPAGGLETAPPPLDIDVSEKEAADVERLLLGSEKNESAMQSESEVKSSTSNGIRRTSSPSYPFPNVPNGPRSMPSSGPTFVDGDLDHSMSVDQPTTPHTNAGTPFPTLPAVGGTAPALPLPTSAPASHSAFPTFPTAVLPSAPPMPAAAPVSDQELERSAVDPVKVAEAQKHARWAISALNYDDLATARKELRLALSLVSG